MLSSFSTQKDSLYPREDKERLEKIIQEHALQIATLQENALVK
jgi:hypothetical protein